MSNIVLLFFDLGIPIYIQRELSLLKANASYLLSASVALYTFIFPVFLLISFIFKNILYPDFGTDLFLSINVTAYLFIFINVLNKILSAFEEYRTQFTSLFITRFILLGIIFFSVKELNFTLTHLFLIFAAGILIHIFLLWKRIVNEKIRVKFSSVGFQNVKKIISISLPLGLAVIFNFLYDKIDIILISKLTNYEDVAFYNIGYGIYKSSSLAFTFLLVAGLTKISYLSRKKSAVKLFFKKYFKIILIISSALTVILFFISGPAIIFLYTEKFSESVPVLKILSFALVGLSLNSLTGTMLNGIGLFKENMKVTFTGLAINIILNLFFIPLYGILAAAVITVITEYFIFAGNLFYMRKMIFI